MGRPSLYTPELVEKLCELIASSADSVARICSSHDDLPEPATVYRWLFRYPEFREQYARAKELQQELLTEQMLDISDDGGNDTYETDEGVRVNYDHIQRSKLRVDTRKWLASKLAPKRYGDKMQQEITNPDGSLAGSVNEATLAAKLAAIQQAALARKKAQEDASDDNCADLV